MSVTDFECAIAKSQIGRYINGEKLGQAVVDQLESHIAACPRCRLVLEEKRNSLMSTIEADRQERIRATSDPIPMQSPVAASAPQLSTPRPETFGALARKFSEPVEGDPKAELRRQLEQMANKRSSQVEIPVVAPAFAHAAQTETVKLEVFENETSVRKSVFDSLALFKRTNEPEAENAPANPAHDGTMKKPIVYMAGLTTVIIAMSLVAKNPTALFGPKANDARVVASVPTTTKSAAAQKFAAIREKSKKAQAAKLAALKKKAAAQAAAKKKAAIGSVKSSTPKSEVAKVAPVKAKPTTATKKALSHRDHSVVTSKRTAAQKFSTKTAANRASRKKASTPDNGTVKVYAPN